MEYGFVDITGTKWVDIWVDVYNSLTARIEAFKTPPENLLNGRHNFFRTIVEFNLRNR